ncbi:DNA polymerase-3 subunit epsilon [Gracilibacillus orientalis]|uniref:DNA polymerase-3 subunit epsilon n=1 Tax=Gracilibacillus orientalis TaxID=334253 RepID=A0A1I4LU18_9BACI|nr:exonuclease domain-containing protein [Gracilibacillus orientalis]SFL94578.1 DNA polymerase-3 subunit epsilon [Gracilibacillus orientalis]
MVMNQMLQFIKQMSGKMSDMNPVTSQTDARKIAYIRNLQRELKQKDVLNTPFKDLTVVVFDIETTGFYPYSGDRILSIGAVKMKGSEILKDQLFYKTVYSESPPSEEIATLTGITKTELNQAAPLPEVLRQFFQFVRSDTLIAHHSSHEKQFMKQASWTALKTSFQHRIIDTSFLTKVVSPGVSLVTLDEWCDHHGVDISRRHHALYDAAATAKLWSQNVKKVEEMGFTNLKNIYTHIASLP